MHALLRPDEVLATVYPCEVRRQFKNTTRGALLRTA